MCKPRVRLSILWRVFSDAPDETLIEARSAQRANSSRTLLWRRHARNGRVRGISRRNSRQRWRSTQMRRATANDYTRLFIGPGNFPHRLGNRCMHAARSWCFSKARSTFVPHTTPPGSPRQATHVPDDHIATELAFMAALLRRNEGVRASSGDMLCAKVVLGAKRCF